MTVMVEYDDMILMKNPLFLEEAGSAQTCVASPAARHNASLFALSVGFPIIPYTTLELRPRP